MTDKAHAVDQMMPGVRSAGSADELGLAYLVSKLLAARWSIIAITAAAAAFSVYYALSLPNIFRAEVILAPASDTSGRFSQLASGNLRGLANLVGIDIGPRPNDKSALALEVIQSRKFITSFVARRQILIPLMAGRTYVPKTGELLIDKNVYDPATKRWFYVNRDGAEGPPSDWSVYEAFSDVLDVETNELTGVTTVAIEFRSPTVSERWANWIVEDLNDYMRTVDADAARASIKFLQAQVANTPVVGVQQAFQRLIEEQTKHLMLTQVQKDYVFHVVDPAVVPEIRARPKRALICIAITIAGFCLAMLLVLAANAVGRSLPPVASRSSTAHRR